MNRHTRIRDSFRHLAVLPDTLFLLKADDALRFVAAAKRAGLQLAGVEGFICTPEGAYQALQEFSNDSFPLRPLQEEFERQTKALIELGRPKSILFQVVLELPQE